VAEVNRLLVVTRLLSSTVHDARNSLQSISGTAELLSMALPNVDRAEERVRSVLRECGSLGERLEEYLSLLTRQADVPTRVDLRRVCANAIDLRRASWGRMRVVPVLRVPAGTVVFSSASDVLRVVLNLILNAERAITVAGGGELVLATEDRDGDVALLMEDAGPGVSADHEPRLFETFVRPDGGLATGLFVARYLAAQANGDVTCESVSGPTRFVARWPVSPA
jgi:signal transduction histidine kinase